MNNPLIPASYLFSYSLPIYHRVQPLKKNQILEPVYQLPPFAMLDRPMSGKTAATDNASTQSQALESAAKGSQVAKPSKTGRGLKSGKKSAATEPTSDPTSPIQPAEDRETSDQAIFNHGPLDTRVAWSEEGLVCQFQLSGKTRLPYCRVTDLEHSDSIEILLDTRNTKTVHRATRFCHRFLFLPTGAGIEEKDPYGTMLKIHLARGEPATIGQFQPQVESRVTKTGYRLTCHLSQKYLEGWSPGEQPEIGVFFVLRDHELGAFALAYDLQLPVLEDPSLWPTAFLTRAPARPAKLSS